MSTPENRTPGPASILIVDDEKDLREMMREVLQAEGHKVQVSARGTDALRELQARRFDLLITDLGMSDMPGWEVAAKAKELLPKLPIVVITGWLTSAELLGDKKAPIDQIISKPFQIQDLLAAVNRLLGETDPETSA